MSLKPDMASEMQTSSELPLVNSPSVKSENEPTAAKLTHWAVNFLGIGILLNGAVSLKLMSLVRKTKPELLIKATKFTGDAITWLATNTKRTPNPEAIEKAAADIVEVVALGAGGFAVLPLQNIYAAYRQRISAGVEHAARGVKNVFGAKPGNNSNEVSASKLQPREESKESFAHWLAGKTIAFVAAVSFYVGIKYAAPKQYAKMATLVKDTMEKLPKWMQTSDQGKSNFLAETIATVTSVGTLAIAKPAIDHIFPAIKKESESHTFAKQFAPHRNETQSHSDRAQASKSNMSAVSI